MVPILNEAFLSTSSCVIACTDPLPTMPALSSHLHVARVKYVEPELGYSFSLATSLPTYAQLTGVLETSNEGSDF
jgi:hypothetical protein